MKKTRQFDEVLIELTGIFFLKFYPLWIYLLTEDLGANFRVKVVKIGLVHAVFSHVVMF